MLRGKGVNTRRDATSTSGGENMDGTETVLAGSVYLISLSPPELVAFVLVRVAFGCLSVGQLKRTPSGSDSSE